VIPYWDIDGTKKFDGTFEEKREHFRDLFRDSVRLHMRSDVEVGGMLSGGMDSSSIASVVGRDFPTVPFKTFTIYYEGRGQMDERAWASKVSSAYSNLEPIYYAPSDREVATCFDVASKAHDVPLVSSAAISSYFVMRLAAKRKLKVLFDGQGADEYLGGYWQAYDRLIGEQIKRGRWLSALKSLRETRHQKSLNLVSTGLLGLRSVAAAVLSEEANWRRRSLFQFSRVTTDKKVTSDLRKFCGSRLNQYLYHLLFHTFLPSLLHYGDRMSMAFSIECRVPFLDHRLVEFAFALDDEDKIKDGQSKYILRRAMEDIVPNTILARRDKQPFIGQEIANWLNGPLKHLIERPMNFDGIDVINEHEVRRVVRNFRQGDRSKTWLVWRLAMLNHWANVQ
jgi:asparagine synthase (glutamine-hydrolysing)